MPPRPSIRGLNSRRHKPSKFNALLKKYKSELIFSGCLTLVLFLLGDYQPTLDVGTFETTLSSSLSSITGSFSSSYASSLPKSTSFNQAQNSQKVSTWRKSIQDKCWNIINSNSGKNELSANKLQLQKDAVNAFQIPTSSTPGHQHMQYDTECQVAFIDLGTNIGDSIGYFVDHAVDECTPLWLEKWPFTQIDQSFAKPHLDVGKLEFAYSGFGQNPLSRMLSKLMKDHKATPDETCVYGMEGNPTFTERLTKLENYVMDMSPRPVRHLHIHTESVVTATDGPTKLYLDKTSVNQNFWGSSILESQQDAQKSAKELGGGKTFGADVQGITLSTLVKNTMVPFNTKLGDQKKRGGLLIIKMDVEGAEYQVLKEVAASGVLCDYIKMGNKVVMIVEFHNMSITNREERLREQQGAGEAEDKLAKCGVEFSRLQAHWA